MRQNRPYRFASEGADPSEVRKIVAVGHSHIDKSTLYIQKVNTIVEYEAGCREHEDCRGHMVQTPSGLMLPPQYMGLKTNIMKNEVYAAAQHAFASPSPYHYTEYKNILTQMMAAKDGKMRSGVLTSPVDGSLRMVVIPQCEGDENGYFECPKTRKMIPIEKVIFIPYYLKDKFKVIRVDNETGRYVADYVKDGDGAYLVREPALDSGSNPLVYIYYWNKSALGAHAILMKGLRGDYDGDELQLYPVYSDGALACVDAWQVDVHPDFEKANKIYSTLSIPGKMGGPMGFMWHTTMSFKEIKEGYPPPLMCEYNRMKLEHIEMFRQRSDPVETARTLIKSSIEGLNSINVQQHSQPIVGDMSRIARLASSSIKQSYGGMLSVITSRGQVQVHQSQIDNDSGNTAVRAISRLCAAAQQAMLSAHRVTKSDMPAHNIIEDAVVGSEYTLVIFKMSIKTAAPELLNDEKRIKWQVEIGGEYYVLCQPDIITSAVRSYILSSYNPTVLSYVSTKRRFKVCRRGMEKVLLQSKVPASDVELDALAVIYTYQVEKTAKPITSREGISQRDLHWVETAMATSYSNLCNMVNKKDISPQPINTITSAIMARNFDLLE
jgi:hypothetical protein